MQLRNTAFTAVVLLLLGCSTATNRASLLAPPQKLQVHVMDVGQGDAILIRCPEGIHELLIDGAELERYPGSPAQFKAYLQAKQQSTNPIEVVVATHPHSDHIGNLQWVVEQYSIGTYIDSGMPYKSVTYRNLETALAQRNVNRKPARLVTTEVDFCPLPEVKAQILRPPAVEDEDHPNNWSVIVRVDYLNDSFLFVGDAEEELEDLLLANTATRTLLDCDFLKAGHHGSHTSSNDEFLDAISPDIVAISVGKKDIGTNAGHKHPRFERVRALLDHAEPRQGPAIFIDAYDTQTKKWRKKKLNAAVYVTSFQGDLIFESDGNGINKK